VLAARGARNLDAGEEKIEDEKAAAALRKKVPLLLLRAGALAIVLTIVALMLFQRVY
jgi:hypothetical protein